MIDDPIPELKRQIGVEVARALQGWRAADVGSLVGLSRSRVSALRNQRFDRFSLDTLMRIAGRLRIQVSLSVKRREVKP